MISTKLLRSLNIGTHLSIAKSISKAPAGLRRGGLYSLGHPKSRRNLFRI